MIRCGTGGPPYAATGVIGALLDNYLLVTLAALYFLAKAAKTVYRIYPRGI